MRYRLSNRAAIQALVAVLVLIGSAALISAPGPGFTAHDKAYYADSNLINFVRPGLVVQILSGEITSDGTMRARVKFTDPRGLPLDREGITTPGAISASLVAARIPRGQTQYMAYTTRTQTSPITNKSAVQAGADSGGRWAKVADGEYTYTFGTKAPSDMDRSVTHTFSMYSNRNLTEFDLGINLAETTFDFVPDGSPVAVRRDIIKTATCNKCHDRLALHGSTGRTTVEGCIMCHQPQTTDPDTGNTVDFPVMIHKIHMGADLPSVQAGTNYVIIGNRQSVHDFSEVVFPADPRNCTHCHEQGKGAAQQDAWLKPTRAACGACHDNVNFATGENHANLPQVSDNQCGTCHIERGELEFDVSIRGAHTIPRFSRDLPGTVFELLEVRDGSPGKKPTVSFTLKDRKGTPILPSQMTRLALVLAGPTTDYSTYVSEDALRATGAADRFFWTFAAAIPANAKGTWTVGIEGYRNVTLLPGTRKELTQRDAGINQQIHFSVDGSKAETRRKIVDLSKCNACHGNLSLHGDNRNRIEQCVLCHNPTGTDAEVRPANMMPAESIDFRTMIHRIHTGSSLGRPLVIYGFRSSVHNYSHVGYPGDRRNCSFCHVDGSEQLPLRTDLHEVKDPRGFLNPQAPTAAACVACHDSIAVASHALANTTKLGESCAACHGPNAQFSIDRVHAR